MNPGLCRGQLIKWNDERGFGFIQPIDESKDIFLHISELKDATRRPKVGDTIFYYHGVTHQSGKTSANNAFILGARNKANSSRAAFNHKQRGHAGGKFSLLPLEVLLLSIVPLMGSMQVARSLNNPAPLIVYPIMSLLTFVLYADDKSRAKRGIWRIPEAQLHLCELAGGWLGGFIAQRTLRHKCSKHSYQSEFWVIVGLHLTLWIDWLFLGGIIINTLLSIVFKS